MKTFAEAIRNQWETSLKLEEVMKRFLNMNEGQRRFFFGCRNDMLLVVAAEALKKKGVTAQSMEDPNFGDMVSAIENSEELEVVPETGGTEK